MNNRCPQHLMKISDRTIAVDFVQTRGTVNGLGGKIFCPIERQSIVSIKKRHRFQGLATLELPKDALEQRTEHLGGDWVKDFAHMRVARDSLNAVDGVQITLGPFLVKSQERGRFEGKHGKGRHERIGEGNLGIANTVIWQAGKTAVNQAKERIGRQILPSLWRNNGHNAPRHADIKSFR